IIKRQIGCGDAAAIDRWRKAKRSYQASPRPRPHERTNLPQVEHKRQGVTARTGRLVDDHHLWAVNSRDGRGSRLAVALREVAHQFSLDLVKDVTRDLPTVFVSFVDDRSFFVLRGIIISSEVRVPGPRRVWQPNIGQPAV